MESLTHNKWLCSIRKDNGEHMRYCFGIFGYEISKHTEFGNFILDPFTTNPTEAEKLSLDRKKFNLTAVGEIKNGPNRQALFDLAGALTFCQQQCVVVSNPYEFPDEIEVEEAKTKFPGSYETTAHRPTTGALIQNDSFDPDGRQDFLKLCTEKLTDPVFEEKTNFRKAFFRNVESWRMSRQIIDFTYYLDFSALEILSRTILNDYTSNVAAVACTLLNQNGFSVQQDNRNDRHWGMQTYAHLRNSLFHNGEFVKTFDENGNTITLKLNDYDDYLRRLLPDLLLKILGYTNDKINWNRWIDRMPFK